VAVIHTNKDSIDQKSTNSAVSHNPCPAKGIPGQSVVSQFTFLQGLKIEKILTKCLWKIQ